MHGLLFFPLFLLHIHLVLLAFLWHFCLQATHAVHEIPAFLYQAPNILFQLMLHQMLVTATAASVSDAFPQLLVPGPAPCIDGLCLRRVDATS